MDALARNDGIVLDRHYSYKMCGPSRASLQSGRLATHVMTKNSSPIVSNASDPVSGYAGIPRNMTTVARKMKDAGYKTAMTGKWDVGMATPDHTPLGRGYDQFYGYYQHANSYWNKGVGIQSTGEIDLCLNKFVDFSIENSTYRGGQLDPSALSAACDDGELENDECYEERLFTQNTLRILEEHDPASPLFLFHSFHLVHTPLDVPKAYIRKAEERLAAAGMRFDDSARLNYTAMVTYMDDAIGEIVGKLKAKGMWEDSVVAFMSDNGGPIYKPGGANNHPLRAGKYSDFEGGIRTNAFVTGGVVPPRSRGTRYSGVVSIADWYGLFTELAGGDPTDREAMEANDWLEPRGLPLLPPVDSVRGLWGEMVRGGRGGGGKNLRPVLHQSDSALIMYPYKLVVGDQPYGAQRTGPVYPNCSGISNGGQPLFTDFNVFHVNLALSEDPEAADELAWVSHCGAGMLFNIEDDPAEEFDLASGSITDPEIAAKLKQMQEKLQALNRGNFEPYRGDMNVGACLVGVKNGGYYGPFLGADNYYTGPFPERVTDPTDTERAAAALYEAEVRTMARPVVQTGMVDLAQEVFNAVGPQLFNAMDWCLPEDGPPASKEMADPFSFMGLSMKMNM